MKMNTVKSTTDSIIKAEKGHKARILERRRILTKTK